jgi:hypothetical protein
MIREPIVFKSGEFDLSSYKVGAITDLQMVLWLMS